MPFVHARLDPNQINPYRERDSAAARKVEEVRAFIASMGLAALATRAEE